MTDTLEFLLTWAAILSIAIGIHSALSTLCGAAYRAVNRIHAGMFPEAHRRNAWDWHR